MGQRVMKKRICIYAGICLLLCLSACDQREKNPEIEEISALATHFTPEPEETKREESLRDLPEQSSEEETAQTQTEEVTAIPKKEIDRFILVDKNHKLPEDWEENLDLIATVNSVGDTVWVERETYEAYLELKKDLMENEGIDLDLDSAYRSVAYQQDIMERFTEKYGAAYAKKTVATPGYSEHHTGLAIDLYFRLDDVEVYENEDLVKYPEVWKRIHAHLAEHGFFLRYPGRDDGTVDYTYEPWHIRYIGVEAATELMSDLSVSFEEWLEKRKGQ